MKVSLEYEYKYKDKENNEQTRIQTFTTYGSTLIGLREHINNPTVPAANPPERKVRFNEERKVINYEIDEDSDFEKLPTIRLKSISFLESISFNNKKELLNSKPKKVLFEDNDFEQGKLKTQIRKQLIDLGFTNKEVQLKGVVGALNIECNEIAANPYLTKHQKEYITSCSTILNDPTKTDTQKLVSLNQRFVNDSKLGQRILRFLDRVGNAVKSLGISSESKAQFNEYTKQAETAHVKLFQSYKEKFTNVTADIMPEQIDKSRPDEERNTSFTKK